jgi:hypothetical protein
VFSPYALLEECPELLASRCIGPEPTANIIAAGDNSTLIFKEDNSLERNNERNSIPFRWRLMVRGDCL